MNGISVFSGKSALEVAALDGFVMKTKEIMIYLSANIQGTSGFQPFWSRIEMSKYQPLNTSFYLRHIYQKIPVENSQLQWEPRVNLQLNPI